MSSFRVGIIGGGIVGTSLLYHLVDRHDVTDVVLFEGGALGEGTTSKSTGGIRNLFTDPEHQKMGEYGLRFYEQFDDRIGGSADFRRDGYLYLIRSDEAARAWRERDEIFRSNGASTEFLTPDGAAERFSPLDPDRISGALFAGDCAFVDPVGIVQGFASKAVARGATVKTDSPVTDVLVEDGGVSGIETASGRVDVDVVVNAAGPWAGHVARLAGVEVPIDLMCRRVVVTSPIADGFDACPLVLDTEREISFRATRDGSLHVVDKGDEIWGFDDPNRYHRDHVDRSYAAGALEKLSESVPGAADLDAVSGWAGVRTVTPDAHPILGPTGVEGLHVVCGFAGHGIMFAPIVGAALADVVIDGETDAIEMSQFDLGRFDRGLTASEEMEH